MTAIVKALESVIPVHSKEFALDRFYMLQNALMKGPKCTIGVVTLPSEIPKHLLCIFEDLPDGRTQTIPIGMLFASAFVGLDEAEKAELAA